jgi:TolB protein
VLGAARASGRLALLAATSTALWIAAADTAKAAPHGLNGPIAYVSDAAIGNDDIYLSYGPGTLPVRLTSDPGLDRQPAFSPDGTRIAFYSTRDTAEFPNDRRDSELYVMDVSGRNVRRLTNNDASDFAPAWSPNGKKIAFGSNRDGNNEIYLMRTEGTKVKRLTNDVASDQFPAFSPDGTEIAFQRALGSNQEIFTLALDDDPVTGRREATLTNLTNHPMLDALPDYSPDGAKLTFSSNRGAGNDVDVWTMNADGSGAENLTETLASTNDRWSSWSPQGDRIVFWSGIGTGLQPDAEILLLAPADGSLINLTGNAVSDIEPDWGPTVDGSGTAAGPGRSDRNRAATGDAATNWYSELEEIGEGAPPGDELVLTPKKVAAAVHALQRGRGRLQPRRARFGRPEDGSLRCARGRQSDVRRHRRQATARPLGHHAGAPERRARARLRGHRHRRGPTTGR